MTSYGLRQRLDHRVALRRRVPHAGITLADCPRAALNAPPRPFNSLMRDMGVPR